MHFFKFNIYKVQLKKKCNIGQSTATHRSYANNPVSLFSRTHYSKCLCIQYVILMHHSIPGFQQMVISIPFGTSSLEIYQVTNPYVCQIIIEG